MRCGVFVDCPCYFSSPQFAPSALHNRRQHLEWGEFFTIEILKKKLCGL